MEFEFDWAEWIQYGRVLNGWSQNEMAKRARISGWQNTLNRIEAKKVAVTIRTLVLVAPIFGLTPSEVMELADAPYAKPNNLNSLTYSGIGEIIQKRRKNLGLTEDEISIKIDVHPFSVINMENKFPRIIKANTVITLDSILGFDGELIGLVWVIVEKELMEKLSNR